MTLHQLRSYAQKEILKLNSGDARANYYRAIYFKKIIDAIDDDIARIENGDISKEPHRCLNFTKCCDKPLKIQIKDVEKVTPYESFELLKRVVLLCLAMIVISTAVIIYIFKD